MGKKMTGKRKTKSLCKKAAKPPTGVEVLGKALASAFKGRKVTSAFDGKTTKWQTDFDKRTLTRWAVALIDGKNLPPDRARLLIASIAIHLLEEVMPEVTGEAVEDRAPGEVLRRHLVRLGASIPAFVVKKPPTCTVKHTPGGRSTLLDKVMLEVTRGPEPPTEKDLKGMQTANKALNLMLTKLDSNVAKAEAKAEGQG